MSNKKFSDRFVVIFNSLSSDDHETALTLIYPLIDRAGLKLYGLKSNRHRIKKIIDENTDFLIWIISSGRIRGYGGGGSYKFTFPLKGKESISLGDVLYKLSRNNLLHEAELSEEIEFSDDASFGLKDGGERITFPKALVWALALLLTTLSCYKNYCPENYFIVIGEKHVPLHTLWGQKDLIMHLFNAY